MVWYNSGMTLKELLFVGGVAALAGCWTVREPEAPLVSMPKVPGGVRIQLAGFDATVTTYVPTYGTVTVSGSGFGGARYDWYGRRHAPWGMTTVSTTEFVPKTEMTSAYRNRATDAFEHAGCILQTPDPRYRVEVRFEGPIEDAGDMWAGAGWMLCTLFTADYGAQNWMAKLKINDVKTGRLVHEKDFEQRYEAVVWGPIPFFSPLGSRATNFSEMKNWCLTALTDVTVAESLDFLLKMRNN